MKRLSLILLLAAQAAVLACSSLQAKTVVQRQPLEKSGHEYKTPTKYEPRVRGYNPKTGDPITYDYKPRVEVIDARAGKYAFKWIGFDGQEKTATFYRADAVDVLVIASVSAMPSGEYQYTYEVKNLPSSGTYLRRFLVQNFASDAKPKDEDFMPLKVSKDIPAYSEGNWIMFSDVSDDIQINPGQSVVIRLTSSAPPGLVECRASAETEVEGADEEMPPNMELLLGGYAEYPRGYTIGPIERLKNLSVNERVQYVLDKLPQFRKLGWMTDETLSLYEEQLKASHLDGILRRAEQDLKEEQITTEVFNIIRAIK